MKTEYQLAMERIEGLLLQSNQLLLKATELLARLSPLTATEIKERHIQAQNRLKP